MLQLMVVSFLQQRHRTDRATGLVSPQNLGSLLLEFFELYGRDLNPTITGISVRRHGAYFPKRSRNWFNPARPNLLAIENPDDDDKLDVGKNSYNDHRVRRAFDHAHDAIVAASTREDWRRTCLLGIVVDMSVWQPAARFVRRVAGSWVSWNSLELAAGPSGHAPRTTSGAKVC